MWSCECAGKSRIRVAITLGLDSDSGLQPVSEFSSSFASGLNLNVEISNFKFAKLRDLNVQFWNLINLSSRFSVAVQC